VFEKGREARVWVWGARRQRHSRDHPHARVAAAGVVESSGGKVL
jgi:hypothetical protein